MKLEVTGAPVAQGYCHCESCRHWSAGPVNAFSLWAPDGVKVTQGADLIGTYNKAPGSSRKWCTKCGGHLMTDRPAMGLVDVYAAILPTVKFEPGLHVFYVETCLRIVDGLPKQQDVPAEMGGSGTLLPE